MPDPSARVRDRAVRLFTFLKELTELRTKTVRSWEQYEQVVWFQDIPREHGCHCVAWPGIDLETHGDVWIEIRKPHFHTPPPPPSAVAPWVDPQKLSDSSGTPELRSQIVVEDGQALEEQGDRTPSRVETLSSNPGVVSAWEQYVRDEWTPWADDDQRHQRIHAVYSALFSIYQRQQRLGEAYEVVVGMGCLSWSGHSSQPVSRHLVTARASLEFSASRGVIALTAAGEGARPVLEQDMLEASERPEVREQNVIAEQVRGIGDALWDRTSVQAALRAWTNAVSTEACFEDTLARPTEAGRVPVVHFAPAVVLRRRTDQAFIKLFQEIVDQLSGGQEVPLGVRRLVEIVDDDATSSSGERSGAQLGSEPQEIYFPLPANEEQLQIARKLSERQGILVQGPPGTGKSHTIANLVCHLLASGQRVLITSHTSRALRALLERFKSDVSLADVASLCVILLGDDVEAIEALEDSVRGITRRHKDWDAARQTRLIRDLEKRLADLRRVEAAMSAEILRFREAETHQNVVHGGYRGTAQAIAARVKREGPQFTWIQTPSELSERPPLSDGEASDLLDLCRRFSAAEEERLRAFAPRRDSIIEAREFIEVVAAERQALAAFESVRDQRSRPEYAVLSRASAEARQSLAEKTERLRNSIEAIHTRGDDWLDQAVRHVLAGRKRAWVELAAETRRILAELRERARRVSGRRIVGIEGRDPGLVKANVTTLLTHVESGGRLGLWMFLPRSVREARYLTESVVVDGIRCDRALTLRQLLDWLEVNEGLAALEALWSPFTGPPLGGLAGRVAAFEELGDSLRRALELEGDAIAARRSLSNVPGIPEPAWHDTAQLTALEAVIHAAGLESTLRSARERLETFEAFLRIQFAHRDVHPVLSELLEAVKARDERAYSAAYQALGDLERDRELLQRRDTLLESLARVLPRVAEELRRQPQDSAWDARLRRLEEGWQWLHAEHWLREREEQGQVAVLEREAASVNQKIREVVRDIAAARAWGHCFEPSRFTEAVRQHLEAWTKAVARIGKGTGKYVSQHRAAAREHMEQCRAAIPAWIMPLYRVAETVRPGVDVYDVVIVDEASQSGPEALFLHYLAKKMVVVGDDKQISPDFIGLSREDVDLLRRRHIADLPHNDAIGVENSFFDQAEIRFGGRIRLREHFRCMPEIIQFSNNLCYRSEPLIPLRQYGTSRLAPVMVSQVTGGYETGHPPRVVNQPEAEAIVAQIERCLADPSYAGKTFGVISLLGDGQAREVERLLLERVGPEEIEKRQLLCGDAYAFQGTERDVMFLSLVVAPRAGRRIGTLSSQRDERRFNVAASRARDQAWLFHTVGLSDLSPQCLRYKLLEYFSNPHVDSRTESGISLAELSGAAASERGRSTAPAPFDSWFEVDVFLRLAQRGYRVLPQFEFAGYRIDLLVEGMRGRVAIECDGDAWHGPEQYLTDMARQRMLERCGLRFVRLRGSAFYRDPSAEMDKIWRQLTSLGIQSAGSSGPGAREATLAGAGDARHGSEVRPANETGTQDEAQDSAEDAIETPADDTVEHEGEDTEEDTAEGNVRSAAVTVERPSVRPTTPRPELSIDAYTVWTPRPVPDPRMTSIEEIVEPLVEIVRAEGPMFCHVAYRIYVKAAGLQRVGREIRSNLNKAMALAVRRRLLESTNELNTNDQLNRVVRDAGSPPVRLRFRGGRTFHEIPPSEIEALVDTLRARLGDLKGEVLLAAVLEVFEIGRTTSQIRERFDDILRRSGKS